MQYFVQFTDAAEATIRAAFANPQDAVEYPNQGAVDANDVRWIAFAKQFPAGTFDNPPN